MSDFYGEARSILANLKGKSDPLVLDKGVRDLSRLIDNAMDKSSGYGAELRDYIFGSSALAKQRFDGIFVCNNECGPCDFDHIRRRNNDFLAWHRHQRDFQEAPNVEIVELFWSRAAREGLLESLKGFLIERRNYSTTTMDTKVAVVNRIHEVRRPFEFAPFLHVVISALFRLSVRICERAKDNPEALNLLNNLLFNEKGAAATSRAIWRQTTHSDLHTTFTMMLPDPPSDFNSHESVHRLALFQTYSVSFPESKEHHLFFSDDLSITRSIEATNLLRNLNSSRSPSFPDLLNCLVIHMILGAITFKDRILASFANADNVTELMTICDEIEPMFHQCFLDEYRNYFMGHTGIDQWAKSSD